MRVGTRILIALLAVPVVWATSGLLQEQEQASPRGIYYDDEVDQLGARFHIQLVRGDRTHTVSTRYPFESGDRVRFVLEANDDCYVYVLNRTFSGDPDSLFEDRSRGIVYDEDDVTSSTRFSVLFPTRQAGTNNRLDEGTEHVIPHTGNFIFDERTGIERLYVVLSRYRVDPIDAVLERLGEGEGSSAQEPTDEDQEVLSQLMRGWHGSTRVQYGTDEDVHGYGIEYDPPEDTSHRNPVVLVINIEHR